MRSLGELTSNENEVQFTLVIPVEDSNNETMMLGEKITLVLFHKPCKKNWQQWDENAMSRLLMTFNVWRPQRPQVYRNEWDYHTNPRACKKWWNEDVALMCQYRRKWWWWWNEDAVITCQTRGRRWWERRKGYAAVTCQFCCNMHSAELKRRKCSNVSVQVQSQWGERQKENKEEKKVQPDPLCHTCQACHNHTQGCMVDSQ